MGAREGQGHASIDCATETRREVGKGGESARCFARWRQLLGYVQYVIRSPPIAQRARNDISARPLTRGGLTRVRSRATEDRPVLVRDDRETVVEVRNKARERSFGSVSWTIVTHARYLD